MTWNVSKSGLLHKCFLSNIQKFSEHQLETWSDCYFRLLLLLKIWLPLTSRVQEFVAIPVVTYLFKFNNENSKTMCVICSKWTIKIPEQRQWCCFGVFIVNFEHIPHIVRVFSLLSLNKFITSEVECFLIQSWYLNLKKQTKFSVFEYFMYE